MIVKIRFSSIWKYALCVWSLHVNPKNVSVAPNIIYAEQVDTFEYVDSEIENDI